MVNSKLVIVGLLGFGCWLLSCQSLPAQQNWPVFLNGGDVHHVEWKLPTEWSPENGIEWTADLPGYGQSSPIIFGNNIYVTSVIGPNKEKISVRAINIEDGDEKWAFERPNSTPEKNEVMVSRAAPSPVADKDGLVAFFEGGNLVALDHDGKLRWERDIRAEFGDLKARHSLAASLEQDGGAIYLWAERMQSPFVMAISKSDGSTIWKQPGLGSTSWSSPRLIQVAGEPQLVLSAMGIIAGFNPTDGNRLWEFRDVGGNSSSTPIPVGDGKFLMGSIGSQQGSGEKSTPSCGLIQVQKIEDGFSVKWLWRAEKASSSFGSPFAFQGRAYFVNRTGIVHCHDLDSGQQLFVGRLPSGQTWATPLAAGNEVYFFGKNGNTAVVVASNDFKVSQENRLWPKEPEPDPNATGMAERFKGSVLYAASTDASRLIMRRGDKLYSVK